MKRFKVGLISAVILFAMAIAPMSAFATETTGSSDSCLSELRIVPGELSPAFSPTIYEYTAWVDADVTSVKIPATPRSSDAAIAYVTGAKEIVPGTNTIKVCCGASDGTSSIYTITVTCGGTAPDPVVNEVVEPDDTDAVTIEGVISDSETGDIFGGEDEVEPVKDKKDKNKKGDAYFDADGYLVYNGIQYIELDEVPKSDISTEKYNNLYTQLQQEKSLNTKLMIAAILVGVVLLVIIVNLIARMRDNRQTASEVKREKAAVKEAREEQARNVKKAAPKKAMAKESDKGINATAEDDEDGFEFFDIDNL